MSPGATAVIEVLRGCIGQDLCSKIRGDIRKIGPRPFKMENQATFQAQEMRCRVRSGGKCRYAVPKSRGEVLR